MTARARVNSLYRLVATYGVGGVGLMTELFIAGKSCAHVGAVFGVSRQAAGKWRQVLGGDVHTFEPHPDVAAIANEPALRRVS